MNLKSLIKLLLVVVFMISALVAQEGAFISVVKVEGKTCIASSREEFETLDAMVTLINTMRKAKSHGTIDSIYYAEKVAIIMKDARSAGIRMKKSN